MPEAYMDLAELFKLLANPIRLKIIKTIETHGQMSIQDLVVKTGVPSLTLSPHLARLRRLRMLEADRKNGMAYYSISSTIIVKTISMLETFSKQNFK